MPKYIKISDFIKRLQDINDKDSYIQDCYIHNVHSNHFEDIVRDEKQRIANKNQEFYKLMRERDFSYWYFDYHKILAEQTKSKELLINDIEVIKYNDNLTPKGKDYESNLRYNAIKKIDRLLDLVEIIHKEQIEFEKTFTEQQVGKIYSIITSSL
jgi:hypothetical protein